MISGMKNYEKYVHFAILQWNNIFWVNLQWASMQFLLLSSFGTEILTIS